MEDIKQIAEKYTREDFIKEASGADSNFNCPFSYNLKSNCYKGDYAKEQCIKCWSNAVKGITFKGEELTAICINDKTERDKKIKVLGITEGKEYQVNPCKYPNYYELVNDLGNIETYFMDRFEVLEKQILLDGGRVNYYKNGNVSLIKDLESNISKAAESISEVGKTWMQRTMEKVEPIVKEKLQEAINNYFEGDKMEDKTIKVRCIKKCAEDLEALSINKEYPVLEESKDCYLISNDKDVNDTWYSKKLFEKVEDVLVVECVENKKYIYDNITIGKKYKVFDETGSSYKITNNYGEKAYYQKDCFKPVEPQKEVKEYSVMELLDFPVGTKFKTANTLVEVIECGENNKIIILSGGDESSGLNITTANRDAKFILIEEQKPVTTTEAFKALDEGKIIESIVTHDKYSLSKNGDIKTLMIKKIASNEFRKCANMYSNEIEGRWIIH